MSAQIIPTGNVWAEYVTVPETGAWVTAESWATPFFQLGEMHAWSRAQILTGGVRAIRLVPDLTALAALSDMANGQVVIVPNVGLYRYDSSSVDVAVAPAVVMSVQAGRWLAQELYGVGTLDATGKVPVSTLSCQLIAETWVPDIQSSGPILSTASSPTALSEG